MKHLRGIYFVLLAILLAACNQNPNIVSEITPQVFSTSVQDIGNGVAANSTGVYVAGYTLGSLDGPNLGNSDAFIRKYNTTGAVVWKRQFGTSSGDGALDVVVDSAGNSYVVGNTFGELGVQAGGLDTFLRKYSPSGAVLWTRQFGTLADDFARGVALDSLGNVYVLSVDGFGFTLRKFNSSGSGLLRRTVTNRNGLSPSALVVDSLNNVIVLTSWIDNVGTTGTNVLLYKYTSALAFVWQKDYKTIYGDFGYDIATSGTDIYFTTRNGLNTFLPNLGARLFKMNGATGAFVWDRRLEATTSSNATRPEAVTTDSAGNVYVSGEVFEQEFPGFSEAGDYDIVVFKYDSSGTRLWVRQFGAGTNGTALDDISESVAVANSSVYLTGYTQGNLLGVPKNEPFDPDAYLAEISSSTGATVRIDQ